MKNQILLKRLIGTFILFMSKIITNTKIRRNKEFSKVVSDFIEWYILGSNQSIFRVFINRDEFQNDLYEMSIRSAYPSGAGNDIQLWKQDSILEQKIRNLWFYNYVLSSYMLIISQWLTSLDQNVGTKAMALKKTVSLFQKDLIVMIDNCINKRPTNTKEVLDEFHNILANLEDVSNINIDMKDITSQPGFYNNVGRVEDFVISLSGLQQQSSACTINYNTITNNHNSFLKNSLWNLYGYGRSYSVDRNEMYYMMKLCHYNSILSNDVIRAIGRYNLEMSLIDSERVLLNSIHDIFWFLSSLGHDGYAGSSYDKIPSNVKKSENSTNYGFNFFTIICGLTKNLTKESLPMYRVKMKNVVDEFCSELWKSIKHDLNMFDEQHLDFNNVISNSFSAKLDFLKTIFHWKTYLSNLEYSDIDAQVAVSENFINIKDIQNMEEFKSFSSEEEHNIENASNIMSTSIIK